MKKEIFSVLLQETNSQRTEYTFIELIGGNITEAFEAFYNVAMKVVEAGGCADVIIPGNTTRKTLSYGVPPLRERYTYHVEIIEGEPVPETIENNHVVLYGDLYSTIELTKIYQ